MPGFLRWFGPGIGSQVRTAYSGRCGQVSHWMWHLILFDVGSRSVGLWRDDPPQERLSGTGVPYENRRISAAFVVQSSALPAVERPRMARISVSPYRRHRHSRDGESKILPHAHSGYARSAWCRKLSSSPRKTIAVGSQSPCMAWTPASA
jgi:hypothetical protein